MTLFCSLLWLWPFALPHRLLWCYAWFIIREIVDRMDTLDWFLWWPDFSVSWHFIFSWKETFLGLMANVATRSLSLCQWWESFLWLGSVMLIFVHIFVFWLIAYPSCRNCATLSQDWPFTFYLKWSHMHISYKYTCANKRLMWSVLYTNIGHWVCLQDKTESVRLEANKFLFILEFF